MKGLILFSSFFIGQIALAQMPVAPLLKEWKEGLANRDQANYTTAKKGGSPACKERYRKLLLDGELDITLGMGYGDNSPDPRVSSQFFWGQLRYELLKPCQGKRQACAFETTPNPSLFIKKVKDSRFGKTRVVKLTILQPALTADNRINTGAKSDDQLKHCESVTERFNQSIAQGDEVVIYAGHARDGGGPDFCPPKLLKNQHVNYTYYRKNKPGIGRILKSLNEANDRKMPPQVLGILACYSEKHFHKSLSKATPESALILNSSEHSQFVMAALAYNMIDSVMDQKCEEGFTESLKYGGVTQTYNLF